jgi:hypothetical protein
MHGKLALVLLAVTYGACSSSIEDQIERLNHPDPEVRKRAVGKLCATQEGSRALGGAILPGKSSDILESVADCGNCLELMPIGIRTRYWLESNDGTNAVDALERLGAEAEPHLIAALGHQGESRRLKACKALLTRYRKLGTRTRMELDRWWTKQSWNNRLRMILAVTRIEVIARRRYSFSNEAWIKLVMQGPSGLPGMESAQLKSNTVISFLNDQPLEPLPKVLGWKLNRPEPVHLELGTVVRNGLGPVGAYRLSLVLEGSINVRPGDPAQNAEVPFRLETRPIEFEIVAERPDQIVVGQKTLGTDPGNSLTLWLHGNGGSVQLWPATGEGKQVRVSSSRPWARMKAVSSIPLKKALAWKVMANPGKGLDPFPIGIATAPALGLSDTPRDIAKIDLKKLLRPGESATWQISLKPSAEVAYRDPDTDSYFAQELELGSVTLEMIP